MNRFVLLLSLLFLLTLPILAQEDEEEAPLPPKRSSQAKLGGAGGFTQNLLFLNLDPINEVLKKSNAAAFGKTPMLLLGGEGFGYIMLVPNLRIGGLGAGGTLTSRSIDTSIYPNMRRDVELSVGFGGMTIEYVVPVIPRLDVAFGVMLGAGSMKIKMSRNANPNKIWNTVWDDFGNNNAAIYEYTHNLSGSFFIYQPHLNIEYSILRWVAIRVGVTYNGMSGSDWKFDEKYDLVGVPGKMNGNGLMINGGIFLGTFLF